MKKFWRILALVVALGLVGTVLYFYNALNGNPVSLWLAERAVEDYVAENWGNTDFYIEKTGYNFKFADYYGHIRSESSVDTRFTVYVDMWGRVEWDTYDDVLSGGVTRQRLQEEYRALTDTVFESGDFPYSADIGFGRLDIFQRQVIDDPQISDGPPWSIVQEELVIDGVYDPRTLGAQAGRLVVYVDSGEVTPELAAEMLLNIRKAFDEANVPFRVIDFTLQHPLPEEGPRDEVYVSVHNFSYEEIYEQDLPARVQKAHEALMAYYAEQDK